MAKKNFDDFVSAAGKRKKPSPEEVDELSRFIHQPESQPAPEPPAQPKTEAAKPAQTPTPLPAPRRAAPAKTPRGKQPRARNTEEPPPPGSGEKVRITVDLAKDLYKRMRMQIVLDETDISTYVRSLIERDLAGK